MDEIASQFRFAKGSGPLDDKDWNDIVNGLHLTYHFSSDGRELKAFINDLSSKKTWGFQEGEPPEIGYSPLVLAYLDRCWPQFFDQMKIFANVLWNAGTDVSANTTTAAYFVEEFAPFMLPTWAFAHKVMQDQHPSYLDSYLAEISWSDPSAEPWSAPSIEAAMVLVNTYARQAKQPEYGADIYKFRDWVFSGWIVPHLKFYRRESAKQEAAKKQEEERWRVSMRPPSLNGPDGPGM